MLLKRLVLQHFQNNVAKTIGFTTFSNKIKQMLKGLTVDISKKNVAEINGFSNIVFVNVVKPLFLATLFSDLLLVHWF